MPTYTMTGPDGKDYSIDGPAGATQSQVISAIQSQLSPKQESTWDTIKRYASMDTKTGALEAAANMASGMVAKPLSDIAGLAATAKEMISPEGGDPEAFKRYVQEGLTYQPRTEAGKAIAEYNPLALIGRGVGYVANKAGDVVAGDNGNPYREAAGNFTREGLQQAANFVPLLMGKGKGASPIAERPSVLDTGVNYEIPAYMRKGENPIETAKLRSVQEVNAETPLPILNDHVEIPQASGVAPENINPLEQYAQQPVEPRYMMGTTPTIRDINNVSNVRAIDGSPLDRYLAGERAPVENTVVENAPTIHASESVDQLPTLQESEQLNSYYRPTSTDNPSFSYQDRASLRHAEVDSLGLSSGLTKGQATGDIGQLSTEQNMRGSVPELAQRFNDQNKALVNKTADLKQQAAPNINPTDTMLDHSQSLIDSYKTLDNAAKQYVTSKYKALADANGGDLPLSGKSFVSAADDALKASNRSRFLPSEIKGILDDLRNGGDMTFNDFEAYRTILGEQARKSARAGDGTAEAAVNAVRNALESIPMKGEAANLKPIADAARQSAAERFARIKADPAYKASILDDTPIGEPSPLANNFFKNRVVKGSTAGLDQMMDNLSFNPLNKQRIAAAMIDHLRDVSGVDLRTGEGNLSQANYNSVLEKLVQDHKLNKIFKPDTAKQVETLGNVAGYMQFQPRGSFVNNSNTSVAQQAAMGIAGKAIDTIAHGLPVSTIGKFVGKVYGKMNQQKMIDEALRPYAGIDQKAAQSSLQSAGVPYAKQVESILNAPTVDEAINQAEQMSR